MRVQILALVAAFATALPVLAGGPPPMYIVVDKVVLDSTSDSPRWIQIHGSMTRANREGIYSKPEYGFIMLELPTKSDSKLQAEINDWKTAVGTGKAVSLGSCGDAGTFLTCQIHKAGEQAKSAGTTYSAGHLRAFGTLYADEHLAKQPEVKALIEYAKSRK